MKTVKVGDKSKAICEDCKAIVTTTFKIVNLPPSESLNAVKNVLAGVCDNCGRTVSIPHQSASTINKQLKK